jgi:hypothetical protein
LFNVGKYDNLDEREAHGDKNIAFHLVDQGGSQGFRGISADGTD